MLACHSEALEDSIYEIENAHNSCDTASLEVMTYPVQYCTQKMQQEAIIFP